MTATRADPRHAAYRSGLAHQENQDDWGFEKHVVCSNSSSRALVHCSSKIQTCALGLDISMTATRADPRHAAYRSGLAYQENQDV